MKTLVIALATAAVLVVNAGQAGPEFHGWARTPPMGWNSWDSFGTAITEAQTRQQAEFMAAHLKSHGWQYVLVDIQWYQPDAKGHGYRQNAILTMDEFGRLTPAPNRFPSAANGAGFKPLADYVHSLGLKFGIHLMRGFRVRLSSSGSPFAARLSARTRSRTAIACARGTPTCSVST